MTNIIALMIALASLLPQDVPASVGAYQNKLMQHASQSYLDGKLKLTSTQKKELDCLTKVIWFEARGESYKGKMLVANVVQNRTTYGKPFANNICAVVYQKGQFSWTKSSKRKQISFKKVAKLHVKTEEKQVLDTVSIALKVVLYGNLVNNTSATHFCSSRECNFKNVKRLGSIGGHEVFKYLGNM